MHMPIIFIHRGDDDYLTYSLRQAKQSNPYSDIILIGKAVNKKYCSGTATHVMLDDYMESAKEFSKVYQHASSNSYEYNLFCFQRWFVLRDYMRKQGIQKCCYIDSDVMLYTDVNKPEFSQFTFEFSWTTIVGLCTLDNFCALITNYFENNALFKQLVQYTHQIGQVYGGRPHVSDMVLCALFRDQTSISVTNGGVFNNSFFDGNINQPLRIPPDYVEIEKLDGKKKVFFDNGGFYCKFKCNFIKVNSLHFQGQGIKKYMKYFFIPTIGFGRERLYFDYSKSMWLPVL
ncbi:hypothetical protein [Paenibacillus alkalitolerans]|uniref:hypothetical protein n=1 Tax=Paenibacillus alkalitolerans TaxID=2799335 RepID=UPI0018F63B79|nr:hypothetical protein [Paenibacillus alkalitolerans]